MKKSRPERIKILTIIPTCHILYSPFFRLKYEMMPPNYEFHILVEGDKRYDSQVFGTTTLHVIDYKPPFSGINKLKAKLSLFFRSIIISKRKDIDIIIAYDPLTMGLAGLLCSLVSRSKLIVEINGHLKFAKTHKIANKNKGNFLRSKFFNFICNIVLRNADLIKILNIEQLQDWNHVLKYKKIVMFHDFVPTSLFKGKTSDKSFILCLGHPYYLKGVDILIEAFSSIKDEFKEIRLLIVGHCSQQEMKVWKKHTEKIGNIYINEAVKYDKVQKYLKHCTVLAVPSRIEAMGRVFIEGMACGKPCVGTRVGGVQNVILDGVNGFTVESGNIHDLAQVLRRILKSQSLRAEMGQAGRNIANNTLSDKAYISNFIKTYRNSSLSQWTG